MLELTLIPKASFSASVPKSIQLFSALPSKLSFPVI